jgi:hypothetical protein
LVSFGQGETVISIAFPFVIAFLDAMPTASFPEGHSPKSPSEDIEDIDAGILRCRRRAGRLKRGG